jgi:hypothetical protein
MPFVEQAVELEIEMLLFHLPTAIVIFKIGETIAH